MTLVLSTDGLNFFSHLQTKNNGRTAFISFSSFPSGGWGERGAIEHYTMLHTCQVCECRRTPEKEKPRRVVLALQNFLSNRCGGGLS